MQETSQGGERLTLGMYGTEFRPVVGLFNLRCGQARSKAIVSNGGWYNQMGVKLGWGDLDVADFRQIREGLKSGEVFAILEEDAAFWAFVTKMQGLSGADCEVHPMEQNPGVDYVVQHCSYLIEPGSIYQVLPGCESGERDVQGVTITGIGFAQAEAIFRGESRMKEG